MDVGSVGCSAVLRQRPRAQARHADVVRDLTLDLVANVAGDKDVNVVASPQASVQYVGINVKAFPLDDPKVRLALHYLVDYHGMANLFLKSRFQVHKTFWPQSLWTALNKNTLTFRPVEAKALLSEAGHLDGIALTLDASNSTLPPPSRNPSSPVWSMAV